MPRVDFSWDGYLLPAMIPSRSGICSEIVDESVQFHAGGRTNIGLQGTAAIGDDDRISAGHGGQIPGARGEGKATGVVSSVEVEQAVPVGNAESDNPFIDSVAISPYHPASSRFVSTSK